MGAVDEHHGRPSRQHFQAAGPACTGEALSHSAVREREAAVSERLGSRDGDGRVGPLVGAEQAEVQSA